MPLFKSVMHQVDGYVDATQLYKDIETFLSEQKKRLGLSEEFKFGRRHPLQHVLNSTSGGYVSPTSMKSFEMCPAGYLLGKFFDERVGSATSVGHTFHTIMERFYLGEDRSRKSLDEITKKVIEEDGQTMIDDVLYYVNGYWDAGDYLGGKMDHQALQCSTETFIRPQIKPLGVDLGVPVYLLVDRVDVRDDGVYVIDYKTGGKGDPNPYLLGEHGYLPQFIFYKWGVEAEYGQPVKNVFMSVPGATTRELRWVNMNTNSLVEQSKVVEQVMYHLEHVRRVKDCKRFETTYMRYCGSCALRDGCGAWLKQKGLNLVDIKEEIPIQVEVLDQTYREEEKENKED